MQELHTDWVVCWRLLWYVFGEARQYRCIFPAVGAHRVHEPERKTGGRLRGAAKDGAVSVWVGQMKDHGLQILKLVLLLLIGRAPVAALASSASAPQPFAGGHPALLTSATSVR